MAIRIYFENTSLEHNIGTAPSLKFGEDPIFNKGISSLGELYDVDSEDEGIAVDDDDGERLNNQEKMIHRIKLKQM
jgi:hypothetical protein